MADYVVKPLDASTWEAFSRLVDRHNGVFGGCWCTWFHTFHGEKTFTAEGNRALEIKVAAPLDRYRMVKVELLEGILSNVDNQPLAPYSLTFTTGG